MHSQPCKSKLPAINLPRFPINEREHSTQLRQKPKAEEVCSKVATVGSCAKQTSEPGAHLVNDVDSRIGASYG